MRLLTHELTHIFLSLVAAIITLIIVFPNKKSALKTLIIAFTAAFIGGVLLDLDHLFDYVMAYGLSFRLDYFLQGKEFLRNSAMYVPLHSWELGGLLLFLGLITKARKQLMIALIILAFSFGLLSHLAFDSYSNNVKLPTYFLLYRIYHHFEVKELVTPEQYQRQLEEKRTVVY